MKQTLKKMAVVLSVALVCAPMGAMAANKLIVKDSQGTVDKMVVTDNGYVGVGTDAPAVGVHVKGTGVAQLRAQTNLASATAGGTFVMMHNNGTNTALPLNNDRVGAMYFGTESLVSGTTTPGSYYGAGITIKAEGNWSTPSTTSFSLPAYISFSTAGTTGAAIERFRIASNGNVGIGYFTVSPSQKLEVKGGVKINSGGTKPTCDATARGTFWVTQSAGTSADVAEVCTKDTGTAYSWKALY